MPQSSCWRAPLHSTLWQNQQILHPTAGRRRREKGPPSGLALPRLERVSDTESEHSDDSAGEKEAKRQRSEPTTPVSTSSRLLYEYDALMGITKVGTKEAEGFEEDLDSTEYHDANDEPTRKDEVDNNSPQQRSMGLQGGYGSSSLKECIELLNATITTAPAPLDSGVGQKSTDPPQVMSPNMEDSLTDAKGQSSHGSISHDAPPVTQPTRGSGSLDVPQVKVEPVSQVKCDPTKEMKTESSSSTREVKAEQEESESKGENVAHVKQEERTPEPDSEDSFTPERVVEAVQRLLDAQDSRAGEREQIEEEREASPPHVDARERGPVTETSREQGYGPYAPRGARRARGRYDSPDPFLFNTTIFLEHTTDANEAQDDPMGNLQSRLMCVEHNIETLRTRLTQVADLRDAQGIRQDHRAIVSRLDEVEEYASANTFREFMTKIQRLESMLVNDGGGTVGEAIRLCTRRIDQQQAMLDDVQGRVRAQEGNWDWSEENSENISGRDNRVPEREEEEVRSHRELSEVRCQGHHHHHKPLK